MKMATMFCLILAAVMFPSSYGAPLTRADERDVFFNQFFDTMEGTYHIIV
jgi:hypothetical protein